MPFQLDPRLDADSVAVTQLSLCSVRLMKDARYPWLILVPMRESVEELLDLSKEDRLQLWQEIDLASRVMTELFTPHKLNIAALGNMVRQLHIHVIARQLDDAAWPKPVWGVGSAVAYEESALISLSGKLEQALA